MIDRLANRIKSVLGIGRSTTSSQAGATSTVQIGFIGTARGGQELRDGIPIMQTYGFASETIAGCDYAVGFLSGDKTKGVALASNDRRYRPASLKPGEAMMYDNLGNQVYLSQTGVKIIGVESITLTAGGHTLEISSAGIVMDGTTFGTHTHTSESPGTPTSPPIAGS